MLPSEELSPVELYLGDTPIRCRRYGDRDAPLLFVNLHENERAAVDAAHRALAPDDLLVYFEAGGERWLRFAVGSESFAVDPNRIFSPAGVRASLLHCCGRAPEPAVEAVLRFAASLLASWSVEKRAAVVALHNTGDDYSILAYRPGGSEAHNAADLQVVAQQHRHDFFLVTNTRDFARLRPLGFNLVQEAAGNDDGSLSTYCAGRGVPYFNIEARFDAAEFQATMIDALCSVLR